MAGSTTTLDAPDINVRRILQKRGSLRGQQHLTDSELRRLSQRESAEQEVARIGGVINNPITSTPETPYEYGRRTRITEDAFRAGYGGVQPRRLGDPRSPASGGTSSGQAPARTISGASTPAVNQPGDEPDGPGPDESDAYLEANKSALKRAGFGGTNVNSYRGSMYAKPGSYSAAQPLSPADNPGRSYGGDARTNYGRLSTPRTDIDAQGRPVKKTIPAAIGTEDTSPDETNMGDAQPPLRAATTSTNIRPRRIGNPANDLNNLKYSFQ